MATINKNFVVKNGIDVGQNATVTGSLTASGLSYPVSDGIAGDAIVTDGAGNLSFTTIDTVHSTATNQTGSLIPKGSPVYQSGTAGQTIDIDLADNSSPSTMPAIGVAAEDIANGDTGEVIHFGFIKGVDTSAFSEGDVIYVGTSGSYTNVRPTGEGNLVQNLGRVLKVHASNGSGVVMGAGRANDVSNLNDGNIFIGNSTNVAETATLDTDLVPENTNLYFTTQRAVDAVESHPHLTIDGGTLYVDTDNNYVGINDTSPSHSLDVTGAIAVAGTAVIDSGSEVITSQLKDSGVTAGSYGSASLVPIITIDAKGRITAASTTSVAGVSNFTFNNVTDVLTIDTADGNSFTSDISNITVGGSLVGPLANLKVQYGANYSGTPIQGSFFFDSLNQKLKVYTGTEFVDAVPGGDGGGGGGDVTDAVATVEKYTYTITSTTNALSGGDDNGDTLSYVVDGSQNVELFVNGIKQVEGSSNDYVATTGTSVTLTYNLTAGDVVDVMIYELLTQDAFYLKTQTYTQAEVNSQISTAVADYLPLTGGTLTGGLTGTSGTFSSDFTVDTNTLHVDSTNNRVGIGTASPTLALDIRTQAVVGNGTDGVKLTYSSGNGTGIIDTGFSSTGLEFRTGNAFAAKIDSSGNVLVGTTDSTPYNNNASSTSDNGIALGATGIISAAKYNDHPLILNRTGTEGGILQLRNDGSVSGSIGVVSNNIFIGSDDTGLYFNNGTNVIHSYNTSTLAGGTTNKTISLGQSNIRFKDLYLGNTADIVQSTNSNTEGVIVKPLNESQTMTLSFLGLKNTYFTQFFTDSNNTGNNDYFQFHAGTQDVNGDLLFLGDSGTVFNEGGLDRDFRVESNGVNHMLFVDGGEDVVKIGTTHNPVTAGNGDARLVVSNGIEIVQDLTANSLNKDMLRLSTGGSWSLTGNAGYYSDITWDNGGTSTMGRIGLRYGGTTTGGQSEFTIRDMYQGGFGASGDIAHFGSNKLVILEGTLRVGKSSTDDTIGGINFEGSGAAEAYAFTHTNGNDNTGWSMMINRQNSVGTALAFRQSNTTVGSVYVGTTGTTYNTTSDRRLKDNIVTITDGKEKILAMNPVTHTWIDNPEAPTVHGFIAQEMQDVIPEAVSGDAESEDMMSMDYGRITPVIVAALQDALKEIEELKTRINELEAK